MILAIVSHKRYKVRRFNSPPRAPDHARHAWGIPKDPENRLQRHRPTHQPDTRYTARLSNRFNHPRKVAHNGRKKPFLGWVQVDLWLKSRHIPVARQRTPTLIQTPFISLYPPHLSAPPEAAAGGAFGLGRPRARVAHGVRMCPAQPPNNLLWPVRLEGLNRLVSNG